MTMNADTLSRLLQFHRPFTERQAMLATSSRQAEPTRSRASEIAEGISDRLAELKRQTAESKAVAEQAGYERRRIANAKYASPADVTQYVNVAAVAKSEATAANTLPVGEFMVETRGKSTTKTEWIPVANRGRRDELAAMLQDGTASLAAGVVVITL